tara:strand:+ start:121 stop:828 length:708 start_codon:yes stop_codon:yes gene_type:complete
MIFISPPFGNYIDIKNFKSIRGSFTLEKRDGLFLQVIKTLRYSFKNEGWVNKIGLRNPGIDYAIKKYKNTNDIISVAILDKKEIPILLEKIPSNMNLELNVSCPNLNKNLVSSNLNNFLNNERLWCIIKLSPLVDKKLIDSYYKQGFRQFHCSNTLPIKDGGQSGPILKKYNKDTIGYIKEKYPDTVIIGGGGIREICDLNYYKNLGASHYSISTLFFNPFLTFNFYLDYKNRFD